MEVTTEISEARKSIADLENYIESFNRMSFRNQRELHLILKDLHQGTLPRNPHFDITGLNVSVMYANPRRITQKSSLKRLVIT